MKTNILKFRPVGYTYLIDILEITGMPLWHTSSVSASGTHKSTVQDSLTCDIYEKDVKILSTHIRRSCCTAH